MPPSRLRRVVLPEPDHHGDEIATGNRQIEMIEDRDRFLALGETLVYAGKANHRMFGCHVCLLL